MKVFISDTERDGRQHTYPKQSTFFFMSKITYRNTPNGKTRKTFATFAGNLENTDFILSSTWLDNN